MDPLAFGALLFGSGSLLGLWVGDRLQLRREHARWLLDQRALAYAGYLGTLDTYQAALVAHRAAFKAGRVSKEVLDRTVVALLAFSNAREKVLLLGSAHTIEAVNAIQKDFDVDSPTRRAEVEAGDAPSEPRHVDPTRFVEAARRDLNVPAIANLRSWSPRND